MKTFFTVPALVGALAGVPALADCSGAGTGLRPSVPDGYEATETEMLIAQEATKSYVDSVEGLLECGRVRSRPLLVDQLYSRAERAAQTYNRALQAFRRSNDSQQQS